MIAARTWLISLILLSAILRVSADELELSVAVAANFTEAAQDIAAAFEHNTGHSVSLSFGSTGQLYTQITQGAPFEVLLAADQIRPRQAERDGFAVAGSRFTYAIGKLILYSTEPALTLNAATLAAGEFQKLAITNPQTAPYGAAAVQTMRHLGVYQKLRTKLVTGNNVNQTYQFIVTRNAELGFLALAQLNTIEQGSYWLLPDDAYQPILQDAVLLNTGSDNPAARAFLNYLTSPKAKAVIETFGYGVAD